MIIVEGPDGCGKTTLAKAICNEYGLEYRRPPGLSSTEGPTGTELLLWWQEQVHERAYSELRQGVYDRCFFISDPIYRPIQGNPSYATTVEMQRGLFALNSGVQPLVIFCLIPPTVMMENITRDGRAKLRGVSTTDLLMIHWMYHVSYALWKNADYERVTKYDYTRHSPKKIFEEVEQYLARAT